MKWFADGQLNVCYNCVDRHALSRPDKIAFIWEQDEPGKSVKISYRQLHEEVQRLANWFKSAGVKKGECVAIYMPMVPQAVYAMLACARIGAVHSVIFAGFSADALRDRIQDAKCRIVVTADQGRRGGKFVQLKRICDEAVTQCPLVEHVLVLQHSGDKNITMTQPRDVYWSAAVDSQKADCPCEVMDAENPLFLLYTSGSTGKPKGVVHSQAGYLLGAMTTL